MSSNLYLLHQLLQLIQLSAGVAQHHLHCFLAQYLWWKSLLAIDMYHDTNSALVLLVLLVSNPPSINNKAPVKDSHTMQSQTVPSSCEALCREPHLMMAAAEQA